MKKEGLTGGGLGAGALGVAGCALLCTMLSYVRAFFPGSNACVIGFYNFLSSGVHTTTQRAFWSGMGGVRVGFGL